MKTKTISGKTDECLEEAVGKLLRKCKKTLAVAESCTGGLLAYRITTVPGSSAYFTLGITAYANEAKMHLLGVPPSHIRRYGAVSKATAVSMGRGIKEKAESDIGIGLTGIAGPAGATKGKPVGIVHIALVTDNDTIAKKYLLHGKRENIMFDASQAALTMLKGYLTGNGENEKFYSA